MKKEMNFRSVVFHRAYRIVKETGCAFAEALKAAWERYRAYRDGIVADLVDRINGFDFFYCMSDDNRVYNNGYNTQMEIRKQLLALPKSFISAITEKLNHHDNINSFVSVKF